MKRIVILLAALSLLALCFSSATTSFADSKSAIEKSQGDWGLFLLLLQDIVDSSKTEEDPKPSITPTPTPFKFPRYVPEEYKDLEKILKKLKDLLDEWPWKKVIEQYDLDGDGTLSPDEIKKFFQDRVPCIPLLLPCEERDRIIDKLLCYFLKKYEPGCNLEGIEISPDSIENWISEWLKSVEGQIQFFCEDPRFLDPVRCEYFKKLKILIEESQKKFREGVPCPAPIGNCDCGCAVTCPCRVR